MWVYEQITGNLFEDGIELLSTGYSGSGEGKNNPEMQHVADVGPIPCGDYTIEQPIDTAEHGPFVLPLRAATANEMFGRSGFLIHGDSIASPGNASKGCIILSREIRETIWSSRVIALRVVSGKTS